MEKSYRPTLAACCASFICQAIVNNFTPLLFIIFQREFGVSLGDITLLIVTNFIIQLIVDFISTFGMVDRIGYRATSVVAHLFCAAGLAGVGLLPFIMPTPFIGLWCATLIMAIGGGLIEVVSSPLVEALPGERKPALMSFFHSFYCWGVVLVVGLSTLYFSLFGTAAWRWLPLLWMLLPAANALLFSRVKIASLLPEGHQPIPLKQLMSKKTFLLLFLLMLCAGASEQSLSQWASLFAELGLGVSKTVGDLLGPCIFAVLMGVSRILFGLKLQSYRIETVLMASGILCMASYLLTIFAPNPVLSLMGCAVCGLACGVMWPGSVSLSAQRYPKGGTGMFALLALAGDLGCSTGPGLTGAVSSAVVGGNGRLAMALFPVESLEQAALRAGLLAAIIFPALLVTGTILLRQRSSRRQQNK